MGNSKSKRKKAKTKSTVSTTIPKPVEKSHDIATRNTPDGFAKNQENGRIFVMGYIRQEIDKDLQLSTPQEIKDLIYTFWTKFLIIEIGDIIYVKDDKRKWNKRIIKYHKRQNVAVPPDLSRKVNRFMRESQRWNKEDEGIIVTKYFEIKSDWNPELKVGEELDTRDRYGRYIRIYL